jgi:hypothetical protein
MVIVTFDSPAGASGFKPFATAKFNESSCKIIASTIDDVISSLQQDPPTLSSPIAGSKALPIQKILLVIFRILSTASEIELLGMQQGANKITCVF